MTARSTTAGHAGQVLEDDARGHERDLGLGGAGRAATRSASRRRLAWTIPLAGVAEDVLEQDLDRDGGAVEVDPVAQDGQTVEVRAGRRRGAPGAERIDRCQRVLSSLARYTRWVQAYRDRPTIAAAGR